MIRYRRLNENIPVVNLRNTYHREFDGSFEFDIIDKAEAEISPLGFKFALCKVRDDDFGYNFFGVYAGVGFKFKDKLHIDYEVCEELEDTEDNRSIEREANAFCDRILRRFSYSIEDFKSGRLSDIDIRRILGEFGEVIIKSQLSPLR